MKLKFSVVILLIAVLFTSCDGAGAGSDSDGDSGDTIPPTGSISAPTVYVTGYEYETPGTATAKYWKDGAEKVLPDEGFGAKALSVFVDGKDVYIAGEVSFEVPDGNDSIVYTGAVYWKDDGNTIEKVVLDEAWTNNTKSTANDIFVSGGNVYVVGYKDDEISSGVYWQYAVLWVNGKETALGEVTDNEYYDAEAKAVFVDGTDVYVAGRGQVALGSRTAVAMYWHNGVKNVTGTSGVESCFEDILADETGLYAAGWREGGMDRIPSPFYWRQGEGFTDLLGTGPEKSEGRAYGLVLYESELFTAGFSGSYTAAHFWENEAGKSIAEQDVASAGSSIDAGGGHIFIAGRIGQSEDDYIAAYWKCEKSPGTAYVKTELTEAGTEGRATSIFVD